jgi:hypothetical protein
VDVDNLFVFDTFNFPPLNIKDITHSTILEQVKSDLELFNIIYERLKCGFANWDTLLDYFAFGSFTDIEFHENFTEPLFYHASIDLLAIMDPSFEIIKAIRFRYTKTLRTKHVGIAVIENPYFAIIKQFNTQLVSYSSDDNITNLRFKNTVYKAYMKYYIDLKWLKLTFGCRVYYEKQLERNNSVILTRKNFLDEVDKQIHFNRARADYELNARCALKERISKGDCYAIKKAALLKDQANERKKKQRFKEKIAKNKKRELEDKLLLLDYFSTHEDGDELLSAYEEGNRPPSVVIDKVQHSRELTKLRMRKLRTKQKASAMLISKDKMKDFIYPVTYERGVLKDIIE